MRRLRYLLIVPLLAGLVFAGAAPASAVRTPATIGVPYVNAGFTCWSPDLNQPSGYQGSLRTTLSFVLLTPGNDALDVMKCLFLYAPGTVHGAPYTRTGFECVYPNGPDGRHYFLNNSILVTDTWAVEVCQGRSSQPD